MLGLCYSREFPAALRRAAAAIIVYDEGLHRLYTTGKTGRLVVIHQETPDTYRVIDSIHLHFGAHTLTVDPTTHFLYVGYASLIARPRIAVFSPLGGL